jgi:hypothetical protein
MKVYSIFLYNLCKNVPYNYLTQGIGVKGKEKLPKGGTLWNIQVDIDTLR